MFRTKKGFSLGTASAVALWLAVLSGERALRLEDGDSCLATVGRDKYLLFQKVLFSYD